MTLDSSTPRVARRVSRRRFNQSLLAGTAVLGAPAILRGQNLNSKLNIAIIGAGGRGSANSREVARSENIVALVDVDRKRLDAEGAKYPDAKKYGDFRKLFEDARSFDACIVATAEHTHALATMLAIRHDKHVYCEKPLTHDIYEARLVREAAARKPKLVTQMGNQNHARDHYRTVVEMIRSGVIGPVREVHVWVSRAWGLQSKEASDRNKDIVYVTDRPKEAMTPPEHLEFDLWLGPAPERPYHDVYFPGPKWYRWWDFGNGTMSDLGSHMNDLPFWALDLRAPTRVSATSTVPPHPEIAPASMAATYEYAPRGEMPALSFTWHQGENKPERWLKGEIPQWANGHLWIGEKGMLLSDHGKYLLLPEDQYKEYKPPAPTLPRARNQNNWNEWLDAIRAGKPEAALSNFNYSGWLTEANHLGNVAYRVGKTLEWDAEKLKATNAPEADRYIKYPRRKGWEL